MRYCRLLVGVILAGQLMSCAGRKDDIFLAVQSGDATQVGRILQAHPDLVNAKDKHGVTVLHFAAWWGRKEVAQLLVAKGADLNAKASGAAGDTPLHFAAWGSSPLGKDAVPEQRQVAELLLTAGADVNARSSDNETPLHRAVFHENKVMVEMLLAKGADVNVKEDHGLTPLHYAAARKAREINEAALVEISELLIRHGADVNAKDNSGKTPLIHAIATGKATVADLLKKNGALN